MGHNSCYTPSPLLQEEDGPAFKVSKPDSESRFVLVCEHASNRIPQSLNDLGLNSAQLQSHVAWDPGARDLARALSADLNATLVEARFSRLVYDCNRPPEAVSAMLAETEAFQVPGNAHISAIERFARTIEIYVPFHAALARAIAVKRAVGIVPIIATIHSFTPVFHGKPRDVEIGFLHGQDRRLAAHMISTARSKTSREIRLNEPYAAIDGVLHSIEKQLDDIRQPHVMIEVRNDLLSDADRRKEIAILLSQSLSEAVSGLDATHLKHSVGST